MSGPWNFRTPDLLGPTYQALGNLVPNVMNVYKGGLAMYQDGQRRQTLADLAAQGDVTPQKMGTALLGLGDLEGSLQAIRLGELQEDRNLQRTKLGFEIDKARREQQQQEQANQAIRGFLGGGGGQPQAQARPMAAGGTGDAGSAISAIESSGRYDALGPVTRTGDRAYGKYQVMGANVGPWTEKYVGRRMSPEEFRNSPEAQEAVFRGEFGRLAAKHGPEGAARAWFAGEGGMNDMNRRDILGTTVADYDRKFRANFGGQPMPPQAPIVQANAQAPVQMAQAPAATANDGGNALAQYPVAALQQLLATPSIKAANPGFYAMVEAELKRREEINKPTERERDARAGGLRPGTQEYKDYVLGKKPEDGEMRKFNERTTIADRMGLQGERREFFLANGKLPGGEKPSATEQKAIFAAEDEIPALESTISTLKRAKELNDKTYTGYTARIRSAIGTNLPAGIVPDVIADPVTASNTRELDQIMSLEAIKSMSANLKGATTDRELFEFQRILGDPTTPPALRAKTIDRMIQLAERQKQIADNRINELRGRTKMQPSPLTVQPGQQQRTSRGVTWSVE